jgi:hypothetical protein
VLRHPVNFSINNQSFTMAPGDTKNAISFLGRVYTLRLFAAEETLPETDCEDEQLSSAYASENIIWVLD